MKIICTQENLKSGLLTVGRIISPNNTLPILNNFLLKTENGILKISSTNLEIAISTQIRCKVEEEGEITVLAKTFTELINSLPNTNLTLQTEGGQISIETEHYHTKLKTLPAEDFPLIPQIEKSNQFNVLAQNFKQALDQVVFAVSSNQTQPEIAGVLLLVSKEVKVVATDRYRLAEKIVDIQKAPDFEQMVILPQRAIVELSRIIGNQSGELEITLNQSQAGFVVGQTQIISRLVDGQYPDYKQIIPTDFNATVEVEKKLLVSALKAGGVFSQATSSVSLGLNKEKGNIVLSSESTDLGKSEVEVPAKIEGEPVSLLLNFHYILDCLSVINEEKIILKIINDNSPAIIVPRENNTYIYLVMPIKN